MLALDRALGVFLDSIQTIVIGAGVVGLAVGRALAMSGREVIVLESQEAIGTGASSRNSEVIHAGIYYPAGSLKARLCVEGNALLYAYAKEKNFAARACGKLIVATSIDQSAELHALYRKAQANGARGLQMLTASQARELEPELACVEALWSPSSGIVDSHAYMLALQGDIEAHGGSVAFQSPVVRAVVVDDGIELTTCGHSPFQIHAREVVNSAGLYAPFVARSFEGLNPAHIPQAYFAKGNYYNCSQKVPFSRLIYPIPEAAGLGVHLTLDLGGQARFGPDVQWLGPDGQGILDPDDINYAVDSQRLETFYHEVRRYWPGLKDGALHASYSGVRPKIVGPGQPAADFMIAGPQQHGIKGLVNLFGIESPGLTAALAIARQVQEVLIASSVE